LTVTTYINRVDTKAGQDILPHDEEQPPAARIPAKIAATWLARRTGITRPVWPRAQVIATERKPVQWRAWTGRNDTTRRRPPSSTD
jgi:hypothetical protein